MKSCPSCGADAAKERRGTLGESKGVWCTACGRATDTLEAWEGAWRGSEKAAFTSNGPIQITNLDLSKMIYNGCSVRMKADLSIHGYAAQGPSGIWWVHQTNCPVTHPKCWKYHRMQDLELNWELKP